MNKKRLWSSQKIERTRENSNNILLSQPSTSSQARLLKLNDESPISKRSRAQSSQNISSENIPKEEKKQTHTVSEIIKYLLMADRSKQPIVKINIMKNILINPKEYSSIMKKVEAQLHMVFGYKLLVVENNKYMIVNEIPNQLPHLNFKKSTSTQTLLFLVLVHIFMFGESCKEDLLWDFLRNLGIITHDSYIHEYFGDVKQLVTIDFVNQRYLERIIIDRDDPTKLEYKWGSRALHEITYRSVLEFVANIYGASSLNKWKLQYKAVKKQEHQDKD